MFKVYENDTEKLRVYMNRLAAGEAQLDEFRSEAQRFIDLYEGGRWDQDYEDEVFARYDITVPSGTATIDALFAALTAVQVDVLVNNKAHGTVQQRRLAENGIMEVWRDTNVPDKAEDAVKDALIPAIGWMKVGYDFEVRDTERPLNQEELDAESAAIYAEAEKNGEEIPEPEFVGATLASMRVPTRQVLRDRPVVDYVPWDRVLWDPTARKRRDIRWHAELISVPVYEVHDNPEYKAYVKRSGGKVSDIKAIKPDTTIDKRLRKFRDSNLDDDRVTLVVMWDYETGTVTTFPKNGNLILNEQPNPFAMHPDLEDKSPFVPLVLRKGLSDKHGVRGVSDMKLIEPLLDELNHYRSKLAAYIAQFEPKYVGPEDALSEQGKDVLDGNEQGSYIGLNGQFTKNDIGPFDVPVLPQEIFDILGRIMNDIREATGVSELMRGIFPDRKRTATETTEVVAASTARQSEKRNALERFYLDIAKRILWLMMLFYDDERVSRLADLEGDTVWEWTAEDITMEADLIVNLIPRQVKDMQSRKEDAQFLMGMLGAFEEVDKRELAAFIGEEMGYDRRTLRTFLKLDEEMEQERVQQTQQIADQSLAQAGVGPVDEASAMEGIDPTVEAAAEAGGFGEGAATEFLVTP